MADNPMEPLRYESKVLDALIDEMLPHLRKLTNAASFDENGELQMHFRNAGFPPGEARTMAREIAGRADRIHQALKSANDGLVASVAEFRDKLDHYTKAVDERLLSRPSTGRHGR